MTDAAKSADAVEHCYEVGDVVEKFDSSEWKITNRMIDVDTDEVLYRLRDVNSDFNDTEIVTDSELARNFEVIS